MSGPRVLHSSWTGRVLASLLAVCLAPFAAAQQNTPEQAAEQAAAQAAFEAAMAVPHQERLDAAYTVYANDHVTGSEDAPLLLIEYASFTCRHCGSFHHEVWDTLNRNYIETGQVRFVLRPIMTAPTQLSAISIILADCAAEDRYFLAADLLFSEQQALFDTIEQEGDLRLYYETIAGTVMLSPEDLQACMRDPSQMQGLDDRNRDAALVEVPGTPSFLVNGKILSTMAVNGARVYSWGGEPLLIDGETLPGGHDPVVFSRILDHFLGEAD